MKETDFKKLEHWTGKSNVSLTFKNPTKGLRKLAKKIKLEHQYAVSNGMSRN